MSVFVVSLLSDIMFVLLYYCSIVVGLGLINLVIVNRFDMVNVLCEVCWWGSVILFVIICLLGLCVL